MANPLPHALVVTSAALLLSAAAWAHGPNDPPHQKYAMGDLKLESGEAIKDFAISYVTHGQLNAKKSNAVLMVTAISGNHHRIDFLIGPGKAIDTDKYFVVCTDAIGNGLTTSPSNSTSQHGTAFPHFTIRDMVQSEKLLLDHLGIQHLVAVAGASMGGMQTLQWGVSHPQMMDSLIALMNDPAFNNGNYEAQPEMGWRERADVLNVLLTRTPNALKAMFPNPLDVLPWMKQQEDAVLKTKFDANDWIAQTWAYDRHDIGTTPGFDGDRLKALKSIKAKTLIITGGTLDLYNPVEEAQEAARYIPDARLAAIPSVQGHTAGSAAKSADVAFMNREVGQFLDDVTERGKTLQ
jgi:homoserine O-acetyltransferase/O-succinyltransferase